MKVLVCGPELQKMGGVATYLNNIKKHFDSDIAYFERSFNRNNIWSGIIWPVKLIRFCWLIWHEDYQLIHFNTSLAARVY
jgi:hypothetical protein